MFLFSYGIPHRHKIIFNLDGMNVGHSWHGWDNLDHYCLVKRKTEKAATSEWCGFQSSCVFDIWYTRHGPVNKRTGARRVNESNLKCWATRLPFFLGCRSVVIIVHHILLSLSALAHVKFVATVDGHPDRGQPKCRKSPSPFAQSSSSTSLSSCPASMTAFWSRARGNCARGCLRGLWNSNIAEV